MAFQFHCPQGHLLEGDPSQAGQQCQCPLCGNMFAIPSPAEPQAEPFPGSAPQVQPGAATQPSFSDVQPGPAVFDPAGNQGPQLLHIPCPNGHELEVPPDMLNQDVMCPHCGVQFLLRERDSLEYKRRKQAELDRKDIKAGKNWLTWAVIFAVLVLIGLIAMIVAGSWE